MSISALQQMAYEMELVIRLAKEITRRYHMEMELREVEDARMVDEGCPNIREDE